MKYLEIRRHTMRLKPGVHISPEGVALAKKVGGSMGPFARVVTSCLPRAQETAVAMGFAVDEAIEILGDFPENLKGEIDWDAPFATLRESLLRSKKVAGFAMTLLQALCKIMEHSPEEQRALVISHGGLIELALVAGFPETDVSSWGADFGFCEGAVISFDNERFEGIRFIRVA